MSVKRVGDVWEGTCKHGGNEAWVIQRANEYLAQRSLKAHQRDCLPHALLTELPEEDEHHPMSVLGVWTMMLCEDYGLPVPDPLNLSSAAAFLDRIIHRVAQDETQDFPLLARELRKCRAHLESVLRDSLSPERGAPCPTCSGLGTFVRLVREYAHWCTDEDCERFHYETDEADVWRCPKNPGDVWDLESYSRWVEDRKAVGA